MGYIDDLLLLPALVALTVKLIPIEVMEKNRKLSEGMWKDGKPKKWYYGIPVVIIWLIIIWLIVKAILI